MGIFTKTFLSLSLPVFSIGVFASNTDARGNYPMNFDMDNFPWEKRLNFSLKLLILKDFYKY